ncbi:hypothetical protein [Streptomyces virginiae]|uniref:hypothetical protein n=1 Tax=Streptomyces virginiae TaxID=1961 RepID=UPI0036F8779A
MTTNTTHQSACSHPGRDITIVALLAALVALTTYIVVMALKGGALVGLGSAGSAFAAAFTAGMVVLQYVKRDA